MNSSSNDSSDMNKSTSSKAAINNGSSFSQVSDLNKTNSNKKTKGFSSFKSSLSHLFSVMSYHKEVTIIVIVAIVTVIALAIILLVNLNNGNKVSTNNNAALVMNQYKQQLPSLKKQAEANPTNTTNLKNYAQALYVTGNDNEAIKQYNKALTINNDDSDALNKLANIYRDSANYTEAVKLYNKAISLNPKLYNAYVNLATVQSYLLSDNNAAINTYTKALTVFTDTDDVMKLKLQLADVYNRAGNKASAITTYKSIIATTTNSSGSSYIETAKTKLKQLE